jgi:hypothetical protein
MMAVSILIMSLSEPLSPLAAFAKGVWTLWFYVEL